MEPVRIPITDELDLHHFQPREYPGLLEDYLAECLKARIDRVRIVHGKGTGFQRRRVRDILATLPIVVSFSDAPPQSGGWGATIVRLKTASRARQDMEIKILHLLTGAREARGLAVIIDVFRAFSTACYVAANGARKIIPVGDVGLARRLKAQRPGRVLMGERGGEKLAGFDYGNSPAEIQFIDFSEKTVIQTTSAGTQGLVNAGQADTVITGSFVNAEAIVAYIRRRSPATVSLVCMGTDALAPNVEDTLCAQYIADRLNNRAVDTRQIHHQLKKSPSAQKFFDPQIVWAPAEDFDLCVAVDRFDFVLKAEKDEDAQLSLRPLVG